MFRQFDLVDDTGMRLPLEKDRLATEIGQILGLHDWRRQPRERGELVDHASEVIHLADDRVGALLNGLGIVRYLRQIAPPQPFGGELDRDRKSGVWGKRG